jgi:hypothetical protein
VTLTRGFKRHALVWIILASAATAHGEAAEAAPALPEIYLIGSAHNSHFEERSHYSLVDLQRQVLAQHPDVICGEITPEAYNAPMEGNFPPEAAMLAEMAPGWDVRFVPADWRVSFAWQARGEQQEASDQTKAAEVEAAQDELAATINSSPGISWYDIASSDHILQLTDRMFEQVIGENTPSDIAAGAWHERNRKIVENCLSAAGAARRIVFVFGASHLPQLRRQLAARGLTGHIPPRAFTPTGLGTLPSAVIARWQRNLRNLEGIGDGTVAVSADDRAKVKDTNRAPVLRREINIYVANLSARP